MKCSIIGSLLLLIIFFSGCAPQSWRNSKNAYERGDIVNAVYYAAQTLQEHPDYPEAQLFLREHLSQAYDLLSSNAKRAESAKDWDFAFEQYAEIDRVSSMIGILPKQFDSESKKPVEFRLRDVNNELEAARKNAAEFHYQSGIVLENQGSSRSALKEYSKCLNYYKTYKDATERHEKMRLASIRRVAIMPFGNISGRYEFGDIGGKISEKIIGCTMSDPHNTEFLELISRDRFDSFINEREYAITGLLEPSAMEGIGKLLSLHAFVFGKVLSVNIDYSPDKIENIVDRDSIYDKKSKTYIYINAKVRIISRNLKVKMDCSFQIIEASSGKILKSGTKPRERVIHLQFGSFTGDERALSKHSKNLCNMRKEGVESPDELVRQLTEEIAEDISFEIVQYFR